VARHRKYYNEVDWLEWNTYGWGWCKLKFDSQTIIFLKILLPSIISQHPNNINAILLKMKITTSMQWAQQIIDYSGHFSLPCYKSSSDVFSKQFVIKIWTRVQILPNVSGRWRTIDEWKSKWRREPTFHWAAAAILYFGIDHFNQLHLFTPMIWGIIRPQYTKYTSDFTIDVATNRWISWVIH